MSSKAPVTIAYGDGIGPEIMEAALHVLHEAGAQLETETVEMGEKVYQSGNLSGIAPEVWKSLQRTKVFFKAPVSAPEHTGATDTTMRLRQGLGLFANVRPCLSYHPYVTTKHPKLDLVIIRENEEDVYAGLEYRQTSDGAHGLKIASRSGGERVIRYAFEYAKRHGRKKVACFTKDNILKLTDGLFHQVFDEIGVHYPEIEKQHALIDIGAAKLADRPESLEVIVLSNLYGDILSDVAAQIAGSVGLAGSSNIGSEYAMFEAIHGSAPRRAGQNSANPSGLLLGGVAMLVHLGQSEAAARAHNAWLKTIEDGIHTADIFVEGVSKLKFGTREFAKAVVERLGQAPSKLKVASYPAQEAVAAGEEEDRRPVEMKQLVGADVFVAFTRGSPEDLARMLLDAEGDGLKLESLAHRGRRVWPDAPPLVFRSDSYSARFKRLGDAPQPVPQTAIVALLERVTGTGAELLRVELLCHFDGKPGYYPL